MSGTFLEPKEVRELTGRVHYASQAKVLRSMGIEHRARPDGSLALLRSHVEDVMGGGQSKPKKTEPEINWSGVNAARA